MIHYVNQIVAVKKVIVVSVLLLFACNIESNKSFVEKENEFTEVVVINDTILKKERTMKELLDSLFLQIDLVDVQSVNKQIKVDLKYASTDNFMGMQLYDTIIAVYLNKEVAERLSKCQLFLDSIRPGYSLLVYDGVRPLQVQKEMWDALDSIPVSLRGKFVSNPARGSVHNYGAAVDLTIIDSLGNVLDMGAEYDEFNDIAFPSMESQFLKSGELTKQQWENRKLLRKVMQKEGFRNIPSEWWHFNAFSRVTSSRKYKRVIDESGNADWNKLEYPKKDSTNVVQ